MRARKAARFVLLPLSVLFAFAPLVAQVSGTTTPSDRPSRIRLSEKAQAATILSRISPVYPPEAKQAHIQGSVVLHAILGIDGAVKELTVVSGPPQLVKSALDAVLQWRYRPTLINGYPVEVDTTITTVFTLDETAPEAAAGAKPNGNRPLNTNEYRQQELQALAAVDPGTAADIRRLLEVTRAQTLVSQIFDSQLPLIKENLLKSLPSDPDRQALADTFIKKMHDRATSGDLVELIIPVYAKHFTHDDIKTMLAFFDSPTGRRLREESPAYLQEVQEVTTQHWQNVVVPELLKEMAAEFPEIGKRKN